MGKEKKHIIMSFGPKLEVIAELHEKKDNSIVISKPHVVDVHKHPQTEQIGFSWTPLCRFMTDPMNEKIEIRLQDFLFPYTPNEHIVRYFEQHIEDVRAQRINIQKPKSPILLNPRK